MKISHLVTEIEGHRSTKLVAFEGDQFVGHVDVYVKGEWASFARLFVREDYRNKGLGSELVETCCTIAKAGGATQIGISIAFCNEQVIPWYAKRGFDKRYEEDGCHCFTRPLPKRSHEQ